MASNKVKDMENLNDSIILDVDSYKLSHWPQYPDGTTRMMSYFESRGGLFEESTLFGLQYHLHKYLSKRVTETDVEEAEKFAQAHGEPFNRKGWDYIATELEGRLPVRIRAIPEGLVVPYRNALMTIESLDPKVFWLTSWLETSLVRLWEGSTVATTSRESKRIIKKYLDLTCMNPEAELPFKLHDFGGRGVTCQEQARIAGAAHLLNFMGSDTVEGVRMANHYYDCDMAAFSIPASEHSTVTMWGREGEFDMVEQYIRRFLIEREVPEGAPKLAACVGDSYDIYNFTRRVTTGLLKDLIKSSGGTFVIRPDSGDPLEVLPKVFGILADTLAAEITVNQKGYRVLPSWIRTIQGDGININSMEAILEKITNLGWSSENLAFGSGGGLLQKWDRDTLKWAFKCCFAEVNGKPVDVRKDPITDPGKRSKAGRLDLIQTPNGFETVTLGPTDLAHPDSVMNTVYDFGDILYNTTFAECRERMAL